ncbi:MAG: hypothetical protein V3V05_11520 [Pontiella sp.]
MPTLNWIGKDAVIRHHKEVEFRLLEPDEALSHGDGTDGNLIVQGDNLHALKALLPNVCRPREMHLHRPALQYRQRRLDL